LSIPETSASAATIVDETEMKEDKSAEREVEEKNAENESNPFYLLVKAAKLMNPVQFELSKDIACTTPFPGV
jgi:hypothetical protein